MEKNLSGRGLIELVPRKGVPEAGPKVLSGKRVIIGRSRGADWVLKNNTVDPIHAVLEIRKERAYIYDMGSSQGTYVSGKKVVSAEVLANTPITLGEVEFLWRPFEFGGKLPPQLGSLAGAPIPSLKKTLPAKPPLCPPSLPKKGPPSKGPAVKKRPSAEINDSVVSGPEIPVESEENVLYPLEKDPNADACQYIFEDASSLYPIFNYKKVESALEVLILHGEKIISVDHIPQSQKKAYICGKVDSENHIEFSYLPKKEKKLFLEKTREGSLQIHPLEGFDSLFLHNNNVDNSPLRGPVILDDGDILRFRSKELSIFIKKTISPPKVKGAPFFRRDKEFKKFAAICLFSVLLVLVGLATFKVDKELKKEKNPERVATILYKKKKKPVKPKKAIEPKEKKVVAEKKVKAQKKVTPTPPVEKKPISPPKPVKVAKAAGPIKKIKAVSKKRPSPVRAKKMVRPKVAKIKKVSGGKKLGGRVKKVSQIKAKSVGKVDTYRSFKFKSTVNSLMARGGGSQVSKIKLAHEGVGDTLSPGALPTSGGRVQLAQIKDQSHSFKKIAAGRLGRGTDLKGVELKKGISTLSVPVDTVVRGSIDPDLIRQLLIEHLPQFRYCYQKILERKRTEGILMLNFTIGASGHVARAGSEGKSSLSPRVVACVVNVLKGIQFPRPLGGGEVEVVQPLNFYPNS